MTGESDKKQSDYLPDGRHGAKASSDKKTKTTKSKVDKQDLVPELEQKLEVEKLKRVQLMADFENFKKRMEQEKAMFGAIANLGIVQELLEISDDLNLAITDQELDLERAKESLLNAKDKLVQSANNAGVEKIEIKPGDDFDKEFMEAISTVPDENNVNKVVAVISSAYKYKDREGVIRSAKVIVGK